MKGFFHHLLVPNYSNNQRARFLHHEIIFFFIIFLFLAQLSISNLRLSFSQVLGAATDLSSQQILLLTNQKRLKEQIHPLVINHKLSEAAVLKAKDMFAKDYWAHNAPDGTTPWFFIKEVDYDYIYAGENLARGFTNSSDIVEAWMASPTHKENMLSKNFDEVGFAIVDGKLLGDPTSLVVEMFGRRKISSSTGFKKDQEVLRSFDVQDQSSPFINNIKRPIVDIKSLSLTTTVFIILLFISVFVLDMIIVERKKIARMVGHNADHVLFLALILMIIVVVGKGVVL